MKYKIRINFFYFFFKKNNLCIDNIEKKIKVKQINVTSYDQVFKDSLEYFI